MSRGGGLSPAGRMVPVRTGRLRLRPCVIAGRGREPPASVAASGAGTFVQWAAPPGGVAPPTDEGTPARTAGTGMRRAGRPDATPAAGRMPRPALSRAR